VLSPEQADEAYPEYMLVRACDAGLSTECALFKHAVGKCVLPTAVCVTERITDTYFAGHFREFETLSDLLADELSRDVLAAHIAQNITFDCGYTAPYKSKPEYFDDLDKLRKLPANAIFVDCGAYDGDTIREFIKYYPNYKSVIAFEPSPDTFQTLTRYVGENSVRDIRLIQKGVSDTAGIVTFSTDTGSDAHKFDENGNISIEVDAIDSYTENTRVDFIKMDVEGAELSALHGAKETIMRDKPTLAVAVYHKTDDLLTIPQFIHGLAPDYKLYLRKERVVYDTVLFAVRE
jgi:FkbM family methyltransferase